MRGHGVYEYVKYMRRMELKAALKFQTIVLKVMSEFMIARGFIQLMPIITSKITDPLRPDPNSSPASLPKIKYQGEELVLTQSMILHKQLSLLTGARKIFIMSPNIRLENLDKNSTGRHLFEFTQMDFEIADATMDDVMSLMEDLLIEIIQKTTAEGKEDLTKLGRKLRIPSKPFKRYTSHELLDRYGSSWEMIVSQEHQEPFWVTCFRREFYDREDPDQSGHFRNYDLIYPEGYGEAASGGEREWRYERIVARLKNDGLNLEDFEDFLLIAKEGMLLPSAGAGIGVERLVRFLTGVRHIGDIQPFRRVPGEELIF